jgi:hypothetical protein
MPPILFLIFYAIIRTFRHLALMSQKVDKFHQGVLAGDGAIKVKNCRFLPRVTMLRFFQFVLLHHTPAQSSGYSRHLLNARSNPHFFQWI